MQKGTERLMPWRTLIEVAKTLNTFENYDVKIVSTSKTNIVLNRTYQGIEIVEIPEGESSFNTFMNNSNLDVLYYPVSWRDGLKNLTFLKSIKSRKIAYVTGGVYSFRGVCLLFKTTNFHLAKPYLLEVITPKILITSKLKACGFSKIVSFSNLTARALIKSGWEKENVITALPGKDNFHKLNSDKSILEDKKLLNRKFYLFMGAPAEARGSMQLLESFDRFASKNADALLVMLMRTDNHSNYSKFESKLETLKNRNQLLIIRETLTPADLKTYVEAARAVVLPFLIIPSEIPLTYFEVLSCATPVITFKNGGTYDYIKDAVIGCETGSVKGLEQLMNNLWNDDELHNKLSLKAFELMDSHPGWSEANLGWKKAMN
jgi:glycosyltransferase involved in cell wall biosynthesis